MGASIQYAAGGRGGPGHGPPGGGWYPDPTRRFSVRYWDGGAWTGWAAHAGAAYWDPVVSGPEPDEVPHLHYARSYVAGAVARGVITAAAAAPLVDDLAAWERVPHLDPPVPGTEVVSEPLPAPAARTPGPAVPPAVPPAPAATVDVDLRAAPPPVVVRPAPAHVPAEPAGSALAVASRLEPSPREGRLARLRTALSSELAVHGLADLGVLLLFAGVFGFVAFAFGDVTTGLRPVAEFAIPVSTLAAGAFLRRRGTRVIGDALVFLGGAILPVVLIAGFNDGAGFPPDLGGAALVAALVASLLAVAALEVLVVRLVPDTPLRFLAAPTAWLAVAAALLGAGRPVPTGSAVSTPSGWQWAAVTAAVTTTLVVLPRVRSEQWRRAVRLDAWPGLAIAYGLAISAAAGEGWPVGPVVLAGLAAVIGLELLARPRPDRPAAEVVTLGQAGVLALSLSAVAEPLGVGWASAIGAVLWLAGAEYRAARRLVLSSRLLLGAAAVAAVVTVATLASTPWATVSLAVAVWVWSVVRIERPALLPTGVHVALLWSAPLPAAAALAVALDGPVAAAVSAGAVAAVALTLRSPPARRRPERWRAVWAPWVPSVAGAVLVWIASVTSAPGATAVTAVALVAVALAAAPRWPLVRIWTTAVALAVLAADAVAWASLPASTTGLALAAVGATLAVGVEVRRSRLAGHVGLVGWLVAGAGVWTAVAGAAADVERVTAQVATATSLLAVALAAGALAEYLRGSSVADVLEAVVRSLQQRPDWRPVTGPSVIRLLPALLTLAVAPIAVVAAVDASAVLAADDPWVVVSGVVALAAAALLARFVDADRRRTALLLGHGSVYLMIPAVAVVAVLASWPGAAAAGLVVAAVVAVGPRVRGDDLRWIGVLASALAAWCVAVAAGLPADLRPLVPLVWGSVVLLGGLALDAGRPVDRHRGARWSTARLLAPVVCGSVAVAVAVVAAAAGPDPVLVGVALTAAAVLAAAGVAAGVAAVSLASWLLVLVSVSALGWTGLPWQWLPWMAGLLVAAEILHDTVRGSGHWWRARWDLPALVAAHGVALVALDASVDRGWVPLTFSVVGAASIACGLRLRRVAVAPLWIAGGAFLVTAGAAAAGSGALALDLAVLAVAAGVAVTRTPGPARTLLRVVAASAALGSWTSFCVWMGWTVTWVPMTAGVAAALVLAAAVGLRSRLVDTAGSLTVSVPALAALTAALMGWLGEGASHSRSGWVLATAVVVVAAAAGLAVPSSRPSLRPWLRAGTAVLVAGGGWILIPTTGATAEGVVAAAAVLVAGATLVGTLQAVLRPSTTWAGPVRLFGVLAAVTTVGAALVAGPAWRALALLVVAVPLLVAAEGRPVAPRTLLRAAGLVALVGAWASLGQRLDWSAEAWVLSAAGLGVAPVLALALFLRRSAWARGAWAELAAVGALMTSGSVVAVVAAASSTASSTALDAGLAGPWVALALLAFGGAVGLAAGPLGAPVLRPVAALAVPAAGAVALVSTDAAPAAWADAAAALALAATLATVLVARLRPSSRWSGPAELVAWIATAAAWAAAASIPSAAVRPVLEVVLLVTAVELGAFGVVRRRAAMVVLAPWPLFGAWVVWCAGWASGEVSLFTVPAGLTVLVTVGLARGQQVGGRGDEQDGNEQDGNGQDRTRLLAAAEIGAMVLMVLPPLVRGVTVGTAQVLIAVAVGIGLLAWGMSTKVRRRAAGGVVAVTAAVAVAILVPLVDVARRITGPWVWVTLAVVGLAAIVAAGLIEWSRSAVRRSVARVRDLTADWE